MTEKALRHLSKDPVMKKIIKVHKKSLQINEHTNLFEDLISSIISQQLSVKAATTIQNRFEAIYKNKFPTPKQILKTTDEKIRACGISYSKIKYIKGIAEAVDKRELVMEDLHNMDDLKAIEELTRLKGIGTWTAEMFLMFSLGRQDIFSMGDLGLRNAVSKLYGLDRDDIKTIETISIKWSPYRTLACRFLWASLDNTPKK